MIILEDTRQQAEKHKLKHLWFERNGIEVRRTKLYVGDYTLPTNQSVCIDTKKDIQELVGDVIGQHERFRQELLKAQESGIKLFILVENESFTIKGKSGVESPFISRLEDLHKWINPRLWIRKNGRQAYPNATRGITLQKACYTMQKKYGCEFIFCRPGDAGKKVIELLGGQNENT